MYQKSWSKPTDHSKGWRGSTAARTVLSCWGRRQPQAPSPQPLTLPPGQNSRRKGVLLLQRLTLHCLKQNRHAVWGSSWNCALGAVSRGRRRKTDTPAPEAGAGYTARPFRDVSGRRTRCPRKNRAPAEWGEFTPCFTETCKSWAFLLAFGCTMWLTGS